MSVRHVGRGRVPRLSGLAVLLLCGCPPLETKVPSSTNIEVPGEGILGGNPLLPEQAFPADLIGQALAQSVTQSIDTSGYDKTAVKSLKMTKLKLTVTEPNNPQGIQIRDLGFLQSLAVSLGAPEQEPIECARSDPGAFDSNPIEYDVPLTENELAGALKAGDTLEMTADVVPDDPPRFATTVQVDTEMTIQFGL
jgi:hypothetical protein